MSLKYAGHVWHARSDNREGWETRISDRIVVRVAKFGAFKTVYTSQVLVDYPLSRDPFEDKVVGISPEDNPTMYGAMKQALHLAKRIASQPLPGPEEFFKDAFEHWPTLCRTRLDVIEHTFFTSGNGLAWLDGCIVDENPEAYIQARKMDLIQAQEASVRYQKLLELTEGKSTPELENLHQMIQRLMQAYEVPPIGPLPDKGEPRDFHRINKFSKIWCIPDDIRDDWLAVCYEAAKVLRDRTAVTSPQWQDDSSEKMTLREQAQRAWGVRIIEELQKRFPGRIPV